MDVITREAAELERAECEAIEAQLMEEQAWKLSRRADIEDDQDKLERERAEEDEATYAEEHEEHAELMVIESELIARFGLVILSCEEARKQAFRTLAKEEKEGEEERRREEELLEDDRELQRMADDDEARFYLDQIEGLREERRRLDDYEKWLTEGGAAGTTAGREGALFGGEPPMMELGEKKSVKKEDKATTKTCKRCSTKMMYFPGDEQGGMQMTTGTWGCPRCDTEEVPEQPKMEEDRKLKAEEKVAGVRRRKKEMKERKKKENEERLRNVRKEMGREEEEDWRVQMGWVDNPESTEKELDAAEFGLREATNGPMYERERDGALAAVLQEELMLSVARGDNEEIMYNKLEEEESYEEVKRMDEEMRQWRNHLTDQQELEQIEHLDDLRRGAEGDLEFVDAHNDNNEKLDDEDDRRFRERGVEHESTRQLDADHKIINEWERQYREHALSLLERDA